MLLLNYNNYYILNILYINMLLLNYNKYYILICYY